MTAREEAEAALAAFNETREEWAAIWDADEFSEPSVKECENYGEALEGHAFELADALSKLLDDEES